MSKLEKFLTEASASQAIERSKQLSDLLMNIDTTDKLKNAHMKTQKEAAKIFQQGINLIKGLK